MATGRNWSISATTIYELTSELKPAFERALIRHGIPTSRILVNVGDDNLTTNDDIREFNLFGSDSPSLAT